MIVYVMIIDFYFDDYKLSESSSNILGVTDNKIEAYKKVLKQEYMENFEDGCNNEAYKKMYEKIESIDENINEFYNEWMKYRDLALGHPRYGGMSSTGYRAYVKECELNLNNCS